MSFLWSFLALSGFYLAVGVLATWFRELFNRRGGRSSALNRAWYRVAGTKAKRAFLLLVVASITFVMAVFNPGEPILMDSTDVYKLKKGISVVFFGDKPPAWAVPAPPPEEPPNPWGWFWWKCLGTYILVTVVYVVVVFTDEVAASAKEALGRVERRRNEEKKGAASASEGTLAVFFMGAFLGLLAARLWGWSFGGRFNPDR